MNPNSQVVAAIQRYDEKLYVNWNNEDRLWEVWRTMPWGDRLVTPITCNIYQEGGEQAFCPLDYRIVDWLYYADSQRKDLPRAWKWRAKRKFKDNKKKRDCVFKRKLHNAAQDDYYILNNELMNMQVDDSGWKAPEIQSRSRNRISYRKEHYEYDGN